MANEKTTTAKPSVFEVLSKVNCNEHTEQKNNLTYLSWAWAWHICKAHFPDASYTIYENAEGRPYFDDGRTCWVKTGVTIQGQEHIEYLPIMDFKNASIPVGRVTSMDMNKAIQRSLTKAIARHGLGLYIYAGEDLPDALDDEAREEVNAKVEADKKKAAAKTAAKAAKTTEKPAAPARGSAEWIGWVRAIATKQPGKSGQPVDWMANFKNHYAWDQDLLDCLEEDAFNFRLDQPVNA